MLRNALLILTLAIVSSCENGVTPSIQWGPNPKQDCGNWLTFNYDNAFYFHDTTGELFKNLINDSLVNVYANSHSGRKLTNDEINNLNSILSCKMYCTNPTDSLFCSLLNPEHLVTFIKDNKVTGYVSADFYSGRINSIPKSESKEYCAMKVFIQSLNRE